MRLLYDYQIFSAERYGGVSRYFVELAKHLSRNSAIDVTVLAPLHVNHLFDDAAPARTRGVKLSTRDISSGALRRSRNLVNLSLSYCYAAAYPHDIVHQTFCGFPHRWPRRPALVTTVHDMLQERLPQFFHATTAAVVEKKRRAAEVAAHIVCVSASTRDDLLNTYPHLQAEKVTVIHHGCTVFTPAENYRAPVSTPYLLYVGRRYGYKDFASLLRAMQAVRHADELSIVCVGGGPLTSEDYELAAQAGITSERFVAIEASDNELAALYRQAVAFVQTSLYEGFGLPIVEAMGSECPVICADAGPAREVGSSAASYFQPGNWEELAHAISAVHDSNPLRTQMKEAGKLRSAAFSWENSSRAHENVYRSL